MTSVDIHQKKTNKPDGVRRRRVDITKNNNIYNNMYRYIITI